MCMGQSPPIASLTYQLSSSPSDQRLGVLIMCEECDAACSRDLGHEGGYTEPSPALRPCHDPLKPSIRLTRTQVLS